MNKERLIIAIVFIIITGACFYRWPNNINIFPILIFSWGLLILSIIDIKTFYLPDAMTLGLLWLGLLYSVIAHTIPPSDAILGAATGYVSLWSIATAYRKLRGHDGMGHGDFKLLAMLGAWLGMNNILNILLIASLGGTLVGCFLIITKHSSFEQRIPFGPFLALGGWLTLIFGPSIIAI